MDTRIALTAVAAAVAAFLLTRDGVGREGRQSGRFQMVSDGTALFRMDTSTGEVVICRPKRDGWLRIECDFSRQEVQRLEELARRVEEQTSR